MPAPAKKTYLVEPGDCITRWWVRSQSEGGARYLVDLIEPEFHYCQCKWHRCEVQPKLRDGLTPPKRCVHYHLALNRFTDAALDVFRHLDKNNPLSEQT